MALETFHLIGIGGIGMSALAAILARRGHRVSGSDLLGSAQVRSLQELGAQIAIGHHAENLPAKPATVVYSTAVASENPEFQQARLQGYPLIHRSELLARLMQGHKELLVAGTHGKTTTTSLLAHVLVAMGADPSYAIGGMVTSLKGNGAHGRGAYFVAEADESDGTFLNYSPFGAIVTNIEQDHMDYWQTEARLLEGFSSFLGKVASEKHLFWCHEDPHLRALEPKGYSYGFSQEAALWIKNFEQEGWLLKMDLSFEKRAIRGVQVPLIGAHNVLNAAAVFGLCLQLGFSEKGVKKALKSFQGVARRLERKGEYRGALILDDYAHHPTEIFATLRALKTAVHSRRLVVVFQPHRYTRTRDCFHAFADALQCADVLVLTEIYSAGEEPIEGVSAEALYEAILKRRSAPTKLVARGEVCAYLASVLQSGDVVVTMGAGDVTRVGVELINTNVQA